MDETLKAQAKELAVFEVWDIVSKIEQSEKPGLEKIPILIRYAKEFYGNLEFDLEQKQLWGWGWNADEQQWEQEKQSIPNFIVETKRAYDKYEFKKALENMDTVFSYYKARYENFVQIYKPFYDLVFKILDQVSVQYSYAKKGSEEQHKKEEAEQRAEALAETIANEKTKVADLNQKLDSVQERLDKTLFSLNNYQAWIDLFSKEALFREKEAVRIVSYLLAREQGVVTEISSRLGVTPITAREYLKKLSFKGIILAEKRGTTYVYSINHNYLKNRFEEISTDKNKSFLENMKEKVAQFKKQEELQEAEADGENTPGEEDNKQEPVQLSSPRE